MDPLDQAIQMAMYRVVACAEMVCEMPAERRGGIEFGKRLEGLGVSLKVLNTLRQQRCEGLGIETAAGGGEDG